jgi:hypothetical protein
MSQTLTQASAIEASVLFDLTGASQDLGTALTVLKEHVPQLSIGGVVDAYRVVADLDKQTTAVKDSLRSVMLDRTDEGDTDAKGVVRFRSDDGGVIEARPRVAAKFNPQTAETVLKQHGLLSEAVDTSVEITDPVQVVQGLRDLQKTFEALGQKSFAAEVEDLLNRTTRTVSTVSEKKVEKLVKQLRLPVAAVQGCYAVTTTYALYDTTGATP